MRWFCLFSACVIYGLFGSPTPERFGAGEMMIGGLLVLSVCAGTFYTILHGVRGGAFWQSAGRVLFLYGLCVPPVIGAFSGHDFVTILRDVFPFVFLFLPLFCFSMIRARPEYFRYLLLAVVLIGLLFSLRSLLMRFGFACPFWCTDELLYLENMPSVLFAALFLIGSALCVIARDLSLRALLVFGGLMVLALLPVAAMAATAQRASLGAVFLYGLIIQGMIFYRSPVRGMNAGILGLAALAVLSLYFTHVFEVLLRKSADVGLNNRPEEWAAVWQVVTHDVFHFVFGMGWGASFYNPAVGELSVNFTHNFFSSFLLKTGVVGVFLAALYVFGLLERLVRVILHDPVLGLALAAPILIDLTLYASFKSLDFGLMLFFIPASLIYLRQCADQPS